MLTELIHQIKTMSRIGLKYPKTIEKINIGTDPFDDLVVRESDLSPNKLYFRDDVHGIWLYQANCLEFMDYLIAKFPEGRFDMIFADPPYFLSNGGITCHAGKMVKVDKGEWDKSRGPNWNHEFKTEWLKRYQRLLVGTWNHARYGRQFNGWRSGSFFSYKSPSAVT